MKLSLHSLSSVEPDWNEDIIAKGRKGFLYSLLVKADETDRCDSSSGLRILDRKMKYEKSTLELKKKRDL
ncbi:hypothetical protein HNY73_021721 [Argiope bruennichi]|uniref:Uncharacterized protein n=1 Tax=Argiope bruennichi TaxID=94029 RepID=A0A8T0E2N2_ARGBR|nr:hypothetical protein HNY73_021721 [Argiope bruennichi]